MAEETKDISIGARIPPSWAKEMNIQMKRMGCSYASDWLRAAVREKLDRDNNKVYEKEGKYIKFENNNHSISLTDQILNALDDPAVIQKLREKLKEQKIDTNHLIEE
jgi:metal-responsive CopG/Arc/MetJ family transcriptional regulator